MSSLGKHWKCKPRTEEHRKKQIESHKGQIPHNKGLKGYKNNGTFKKGHKDFLSNEDRIEIGKKLAIKFKGRKSPWQEKERHHNWQGGEIEKRINTENKKYNHWRQQVLKKYDNTCQKCFSREKLDTHHLLSVRKCIKYKREDLIYNIDNGIVLCHSCHHKCERYDYKQ